MKANQSFARADEAVSPVIGVILMVAITVVLGAVVFVLVGNLTESGDESPEVTFIKNEQQNTLTVQNVNWNGAQLVWGNASAANTLVVNNVCTGSGNVTAGSILTCGAGTVTIVHSDTDSLIYTTTFS